MLTSSLAALLLAVPQGSTAPEPNADNLQRWSTYVRPSASERGKVCEIGWRNELWPAVLEAREIGRPILLWTMNGHPLGCT